MERGLLSLTNTDGGFLSSFAQSQPFPSPDSYISSGGTDLFGLHSPFVSSPKHGGGVVSGLSSASLSQTPSTVSLVDDVDDQRFIEEQAAAAATERRLCLARLALQHQEITNRCDRCFTHYRVAIQEADALRQENAQLRLSNAELTHRLALLTGAARIQKPTILPSRTLSAPSRTLSTLADEFRRLGVSGDQDHSPTSVLGLGQQQQCSTKEKKKCVPLPKSISIRSSGFLKLNNSSSNSSSGDCSIAGGSAAAAARTNRNGRSLVSSPLIMGLQQQQQRLLVGTSGNNPDEGEGQNKLTSKGNGDEDPLELEVFNQGMFKTELCNKWEEKGECSYGDHCQFAHGISELRPVIRHPRYKTEVCRMVLAGDTCPYGHRCHFRHALSAQDLLLLQRPTTSAAAAAPIF